MLEILNGNLPKKESGLQAAFTTPGTYYWTVPAGVTSISAVAVGGGGGSWDRTKPISETWGSPGIGGMLRYKVSIAVTPREVLTIEVGAAGTNTTAIGYAGAGGNS